MGDDLGTLPALAGALAISGLAGVVRGITGFGSALVIAPLLARLVGPVEAVAMTLMMGAAASTLLLPRYASGLQARLVSPVAVAGLVLLVPGVLLLRFVDPELMRRSLALVMTVTAAALWLAPGYEGPSGLAPSITAGAIGGLIMGATSMGGPPVVLYLVSRPGTAEQKKANVVVAVGALEAGAVAMLAVLDAITAQTLVRFAMLLPVFLAGTCLGERAFRGRAGPNYQNLTLALLLATGIGLLIF